MKLGDQLVIDNPRLAQADLIGQNGFMHEIAAEMRVDQMVERCTIPTDMFLEMNTDTTGDGRSFSI